MRHEYDASRRAPIRSGLPLFGCVLGAVAVILSVGLTASGVAAGRIDKEGLTVVIENPPKAGSRARMALARAAGDPRIEPLDMSRGEAWRISALRLKSFKSAASRLGIRLTAEDSAAGSPMLIPMHGKAAMPAEQSRMISLTQGNDATMSVMMVRTPTPATMEFLLTRGMNEPDAAPAAIELPIDDKRTIRLQRTRIERAADRWTWHGLVEGTDQKATLLWWPSGRLSGSIAFEGMTYSIREMGAGMHALIKIDPNMMPLEHAPSEAMRVRGGDVMSDPLVKTGEAIMMRPAEMQRTSPRNLPSMVEPTGDVTIDLVVAYTKAARRHYSDIKRDLVALAVDEANQSFRNSQIENVRLRLVHAYETDYIESGGHFDHLWRFADRGDGIMEEIHRVRDEHKADVAVLIVDDRVGCGLATRVAADADEAFAVVHHECAATSYTVAHEVGHIIGARHDRALDQSSHPFEFGHGYVHGTEWRTMMSYKQSCNNCPRLPFWSNPAVRIRGVPAGSEQHNNAKAIALGAARVAGFR